jgi:hypothetical protein
MYPPEWPVFSDGQPVGLASERVAFLRLAPGLTGLGLSRFNPYAARAAYQLGGPHCSVRWHTPPGCLEGRLARGALHHV